MILLKQFIKEVLDGFSMAGARRIEAPSNLRYDVPVRPGGPHIDSFESSCPECGSEPGCNIDCELCTSIDLSESTTYKKAACVLILSDDGKILAVSRKNDPGDFGMPGGKVDPGETPLEAAQRELTEETGLHAHDLKQVFVKFDGNSVCYTFMGKIDGEISTTEPGVIRWVDPSVLLKGSFESYNRDMFRRLGLM